MDEYEAEDDALLMAEKLKGIPVVKGQNRYEAGVFAVNNIESRISNIKSRLLFILDDGFQHWALFRDKDIVLIDSSVPFGNRRMLPLGTLREPVKEIRRADIIVITKTDLNRNQHTTLHDLAKELKKYNPHAPIFFAEHKPSAFFTTTGESLPLQQAKGKRVFAF